MEFSDHSGLIGGLLIRQSPALAIEITALWFALSRRRSLGRAASWAAWGFSLLIAYALAGVVLQYLLTLDRIGEVTFESGTQTVTSLGIWTLAAYPLFIGGLGALARAVFIDRGVKVAEPVDGAHGAGR